MDKEQMLKLFEEIKEKIKSGEIDNDNMSGFPAESLHTEDLDDFFGKHFPGGEGRVFHEILSDIVHIDIGIIPPAEGRDYTVLYTSGMSDLSMTMPEGMPEKDKERLSRAELMMLLPADWKLDEEAFKDERNYWPVRALKTAARFPHEYETWFAHGHDLQFTEPCEPFADNTGLCALLFAYPDEEELKGFTASDGMYINIYTVIPIYEEELMYKLNEEDGKKPYLFELIFGEGDAPVDKRVIDINRKNVCKDYRKDR